MATTPPVAELNKKAYEIAYALSRVAASNSHATFAGYLEGYALMLLDASSRGHHGTLLEIIAAIRQFSQFGADSGMMHPRDSEIIDSQLILLYSAIPQSGNSQFAESVVSESFFDRSDKHQPSTVVSSSSSQDHSPHRSSASVSDRQEKIIAAIRQSGNCRLKDLQDVLSDVSERTLRYDIQELISKGKIDRIGSGGPSTYYRIHEELVPSSGPAPEAQNGEKEQKFLFKGEE